MPKHDKDGKQPTEKSLVSNDQESTAVEVAGNISETGVHTSGKRTQASGMNFGKRKKQNTGEGSLPDFSGQQKQIDRIRSNAKRMWESRQRTHFANDAGGKTRQEAEPYAIYIHGDGQVQLIGRNINIRVTTDKLTTLEVLGSKLQQYRMKIDGQRLVSIDSNFITIDNAGKQQRMTVDDTLRNYVESLRSELFTQNELKS